MFELMHAVELMLTPTLALPHSEHIDMVICQVMLQHAPLDACMVFCIFVEFCNTIWDFIYSSPHCFIL